MIETRRLKNAVFKNFVNFTGKHQSTSLFFNRVMGLKADMRIRSFLRMYDFGVKEQFESIINKLTLLLVYFYDAYDVNP